MIPEPVGVMDYETFCKIRDCHDRQGVKVVHWIATSWDSSMLPTGRPFSSVERRGLLRPPAVKDRRCPSPSKCRCRRSSKNSRNRRTQNILIAAKSVEVLGNTKLLLPVDFV
jgi:hypothetical protein